MITVEIATAGDPERAVVMAAAAFTRKGEVWSIIVRHDDGCLCTTINAPTRACSCEIVELQARRVDP